jgi:hypothetical protein
MTGLIAGSLALLAAAAVAVVYGWITANQTFVLLSIAASVGTAVLLALAYSRSRAEVVAALQRRRMWRGAPRRSPPPVASGAAAATSTAPTTGRGRHRASPTDVEVIAVPGVRKYHRPECRYARVSGAERMMRSSARRRSFEACGICRP